MNEGKEARRAYDRKWGKNRKKESKRAILEFFGKTQNYQNSPADV